jgi:hypothetical protein
LNLLEPYKDCSITCRSQLEDEVDMKHDIECVGDEGGDGDALGFLRQGTTADC